MVLTSDDVYFQPGLTESIIGENAEFLDSAYKESLIAAKEAGYGEKPKLMISYAPLLLNVGGDFFIQSMSKASGGVPNFGTLAIDYTTDYSKAQVIYEGEAYSDKYAFVLMIGEVSPKFYVAGIKVENVLSETGVVTDVAGNQIKTINGLSASDFMVTLGLKKDENDKAIGVNSYPFIVDYNDGTEPVVRVIFMITEEGYAVCGGDVPLNATLSVGMFDLDAVLDSTAQKIENIMRDKPSALLMFSCVGRYFAQGYEPHRETSIVREFLETSGVPYTFTYSGGEICPVYHRGTTDTEDRFHNDTFIACMF
jgi:hypothetical protein